MAAAKRPPARVKIPAISAAAPARWRYSASQARVSSTEELLVVAAMEPSARGRAPGPHAALDARLLDAVRRRPLRRVAVDGAGEAVPGGQHQVERGGSEAQGGLDAPAPGELRGGRRHGAGLYGSAGAARSTLPPWRSGK